MDAALGLFETFGLRRPVDPAVVGRARVFAAAVGIGVVQPQIALQRCRRVVMIFVATIVATIYVLLAGAPLTEPLTGAARAHLVAGTLLLIAAFQLVPRFETVARSEPAELMASRMRA